MALAAHESERQLVPVEDVNATDAYGYTMLLFAARDGDLRRCASCSRITRRCTFATATGPLRSI
ncbi:uncharacterized protein PITG_08691 [Phytophthora infestans T30-4]|uniref:Uncharacterized protein n=1 Tax=Phytophthora infestans (strain T30-4) TaxID=403677 RepID=D0NCY8_PHYIT|nr:uncharacterized protein PITG_08691 [Phytophthora infestans T30-4]EEY55945.1 conserved hypothetical protein [Phytophthora infestans T30-4]|eukprot:XP_002902775.1 conserved hypothetical protein [Phytophthora infestans T30-4]